MRALSTIFLSFLLVAFLGCSDVPTSALQEADADALTDAEPDATAKGNSENIIVVPVDTIALNQCTGEEIHLTATSQMFFNSLFDAAGGAHFTVHSNFTGTGVGLTTGTEYVWNRSVNQTQYISFPDVFPFIINYVSVRNVVSKGGDTPNWLLKESFTLTINGIGDVVIDPDEDYNLDFECK